MSAAVIGLSLLAVAVGLLAWFVVRLRARVEALRKLVSDEWNELLQAQQALRQLGDQRLDERLGAVEERLDAVAEEQRQMLMRDSAISSYSAAIRQARAGVGVEQLMAEHDLGPAEAELIVRLHAGESGAEESAR